MVNRCRAVRVGVAAALFFGLAGVAVAGGRADGSAAEKSSDKSPGKSDDAEVAPHRNSALPPASKPALPPPHDESPSSRAGGADDMEDPYEHLEDALDD